MKITVVADGRFEVRRRLADNHHSLFARAAFAPGDVVTAFGARAASAEPSRHSLQTDLDEHIQLEPEFLGYLNHGCRPNLFVDTRRRLLRAIREVVPGDELVFFYPSTEWRMAEPFTCHCGAPECLGRIAGASELPPDVLEQYELAPHIEELLAGDAYRARARRIA